MWYWVLGPGSDGLIFKFFWFVCVRGNFVVVMGVFMLPITVKSSDLFSQVDSNNVVVPLVLSRSVLV